MRVSAFAIELIGGLLWAWPMLPYSHATAVAHKSLKSFSFASLVKYVTPHGNILLLALLLMIGESAIALANPWIAGQVTGLILEDVSAVGIDIRHLLLLWLGILFVQAVLSFGNRYILGATGETMLAELRTRLYDHLQSLPLSYFHDRRRGEVLSLLSHDATQVSNFVTGTLIGLLPLALTFFGALYFLFKIDVVIGGLVILLVPAFYIAIKLIGRKMRPLSSQWIDSHARMFSTLEENLGLLPAIKSFTRESIESERFQKHNADMLRIAKRHFLIQSVLDPSIRFLAGVGLLLLVYFGSRRVIQGTLSPSDMVSLLLYGMLLTRPVGGLANVYGSIQSTRGAAQRLVHLFAEQPEPEDAGAKNLERVQGRLELRDITFAYPGRQPVLDGLNLVVEAGETVALTGENGSGKSTIAHLIQRFADPEKGNVLVDGIDVRDVSIISLRSQIRVVAQHVLLLNGSVRENIAYAQPDSTDQNVIDAAIAARAHDFIMELPEGYDTLIGDQGIRLSGGQRQRIALARALLKDPPILILDEATAMFDPEGEREFLLECRNVLEERTVLLITHRPASLELADRVLRLDSGKLS